MSHLKIVPHVVSKLEALIWWWQDD